MGVHGLWGFARKQPQRSLLFEERDLSSFAGQTLLIDADSFFYFAMEVSCF